MNILIPYLHYIGIMLLMGSLITEHVLLKPGISKQQIKSLAFVDKIYIIAIALVLITGLLRWFFVDPKGAEYFTRNHIFHIKVTVFIVLAILSVFPSLKFLKWGKQSGKQDDFSLSEKETKKQLLFIRIELLLLAILPLLAIFVAQNVRM